MDNPSIKHFVLRTLLAAVPLLALPVAYVLWDPFWVLRSHGGDAMASPHDTELLSRNAGWVAVKNLKQYGDSVKPDSFIFGSSMSQNFHADHWKRYLPEGASVYHMDQSMETLAGIAEKADWLADNGYRVRHALVIIEEEMLHRSPADGDFLFVRPPQTTADVSMARFQWLGFQLFKEPDFLLWTVSARHTAAETSSTRRQFLTTDLPLRDAPRNESRYATFDSLIATDPDAYFTPERLRRIEYNEDLTPPQPAIDGQRMQQLLDIANSLQRQGATFTVIIVPRYHRRHVMAADLEKLRVAFGTDRVHDFSGDAALASDPRRYYDHAGHPTAATCRLLLDRALTANEDTTATK